MQNPVIQIEHRQIAAPQKRQKRQNLQKSIAEMTLEETAQLLSPIPRPNKHKSNMNTFAGLGMLPEERCLDSALRQSMSQVKQIRRQKLISQIQSQTMSMSSNLQGSFLKK